MTPELRAFVEALVAGFARQLAAVGPSKVTRSAELHELAAALAAAQAEIRAAPKAKTNPHFKSRYADLDDCWDAAREPLSKNGLAVTQWPVTDGAKVTIVTILLHKSGQFLSGELGLQAMDGKPQAVGSAITYGRRYAFSSAVGITSDEDDDGNAGSGRNEPEPPGRPPDNFQRGQTRARVEANAAEPEDAPPAANEKYTGKPTQRDAIKVAAARHGITDNPTLHAIGNALKGKFMSELEKAILKVKGAGDANK